MEGMINHPLLLACFIVLIYLIMTPKLWYQTNLAENVRLLSAYLVIFQDELVIHKVERIATNYK